VEPVLLVSCLLGGALLGFIIGYLAVQSRANRQLGAAELQREENERAKTEIASVRERLESLIADNNRLQTQIEAERKAFEEQRSLLEEAKTKLEDTFKALSSDALQRNNRQFLELATESLEKFNQQAKGDLEKRQQAIGELVKPIEEKLKSFDENIKGMEKERVGAYEQLKEIAKGIVDGQTRLQAETNNLVRALRNPQQRGQWGEMQLETILKMAGLEEGVHFRRQEHRSGEDGAIRPDTVVFLPTGREIVIDSKAPLDAYLDAQDISDEEGRAAKLRDHARHVKSHVQSLTKKAYWDKFQSADFVVMFLPGESIFSAAVQHDSTLLEFGVENKVFIASPMTLITMLRAVAMGWRQEKLAENAKKISDEAKLLYERIGVLGKHFGKVGRELDSAVSAYNEAVGSLDTRVLPQVRKLKDLKVATDDLPSIEPVERKTREIQSIELRELSGVALVEDEPVTKEDASAEPCEAEPAADGTVTVAAQLFDEASPT
jgi:DNA recombination protein RmuC